MHLYMYTQITHYSAFSARLKVFCILPKAYAKMTSICRARKFCKGVKDRFHENFDERYSWTIYFLVDLKVVYIVTYAFITIVNLISSTANSEAFSDRNSMMLLNVSSQHMNVNVTSINDAILWNCRRLSETKDYYRVLYWMLLTAVIVALVGFFIIKFVTLITISSGFGCEWCSCKCSTFKHGLTKLWQIALCKQLINPIQGKRNPGEGSQLQSVEANANKYDVHSKQNSIIGLGSENCDDKTVKAHQCNATCYQKWLDGDIPDDIVKELGCCKGFLRTLIPYVLLVLLVTLMCLAYLSFDLHPLACITEEELITYDFKKNAVELEVSHQLSDYRTSAGYLFLVLGFVFLALVKTFFYCTTLVVEEIQQKLVGWISSQSSHHS